MPQQPAQRGIRTGQAVGLAVFLVSAIFLVAFFVTGLGTSFDSLQRTAASLSTLSAAVAASAMLIDGVDLWVRGRKMAPSSVRIVRSLIFVAQPLLCRGDGTWRVTLRRRRLAQQPHRKLDQQVAAAQGRQEAPLRRPTSR